MTQRTSVFSAVFSAATSAVILAGIMAGSAPANATDLPKSHTPTALAQAECGACHLPYLPKFLPADAWAKLFDTLDSHFGEDARTKPEDIAAIRRYYLDHAGWGEWAPTPAQPLPRITTQTWWKRAMGDLDVRKPRIRSRANCGACHTHADWYMAVRE